MHEESEKLPEPPLSFVNSEKTSSSLASCPRSTLVRAGHKLLWPSSGRLNAHPSMVAFEPRSIFTLQPESQPAELNAMNIHFSHYLFLLKEMNEMPGPSSTEAFAWV